jgi:hypothetical protein
MPELDPVRQEIIVDAAEALAAFDALIEKAQQFADAIAAMDRRLFAVAEAATLAGEGMQGAADQAARLTGSLAGVGAAASAASSGLGDVRTNAAEAAVATTALAASTAAAATGAAATAATGGLIAAWWGQWGNVVHWVVMGTLEIAATALPALVAFGAALGAMYPTIDGLKDHFTNLVTATGGIGNALRAIPGPLGSVSSGFGKLTEAVAPDVFIMLGSAIDIATMHTGLFANMAQQASNVLAQFTTRIVADLNGPAGAALAGFFQNAVKYMIQWGQFLGNLGHTFINVASAMFGVGQILLDVLVQISRVLLDISGNPVAAVFIGLAAAMSAAYRYAILLRNIFTFLGGTALVQNIIALAQTFGILRDEIGTADAAMAVFEGTLSLIAGPIGVIGALAGSAFMIWYLEARNVTDATRNLIQQVQSAPNDVQHLSSGIITLSTAMQAASARTQQFSKDIINGTKMSAGAAAATRELNNDTMALSTATAQQVLKLQALITGLQGASTTAGQTAANMTALSFATSMQDSHVQALNQAWDQYMQILTGGESSLANFSTTLANMTTVTATTGLSNLARATQTLTLNAAQFSAALASGPMTSKGAAAWQNFSQMMSSTLPQLADWAQTAKTAGAITQSQFGQAIVDSAAQLIPFVSGSREATNELLAFADRSGMTFTSLGQLAGQYAKTGGSASQLTGIINKGTDALSNMSSIAKNMSATLNTQVTQAIAAASLKASGFDTAMANMITAQKNNTTVGGKTWQQWLSIAQGDLQQAQKSAATAAAGINGELAKIPDVTNKYVNIIVSQLGSYSTPAGLGAGKLAALSGPGGASGGMVHGPGTSTSDSVHAMLSRGEYVMRAAAVQHYGVAAMDALNARRMAGGGQIGPGIMPAILHASMSGGTGPVNFTHTSVNQVRLNGRLLQAQQRTEVLKYARRNPGSNWNLRIR